MKGLRILSPKLKPQTSDFSSSPLVDLENQLLREKLMLKKILTQLPQFLEISRNKMSIFLNNYEKKIYLNSEVQKCF